MRVLTTAFLSISLGLLGACDNSAKSGTLIGAGGGALAGQAIGGNTKGTLIGAGVGALGGYIVGNEMDKKRKQEQAEARANSPVYNQQQQQKNLQAENERLRAEIENELSNQNSIRKLVDASDVAALVTFLASPLSVAVTGEVIAAGGGVGTGIYY